MPDLSHAQTAVDVKKGVIYTLINNQWVPRKMNAAEVEKYTPKVAAPKPPEEESALAKAIRGTEAGAFEGAGISLTMKPVEDTLKALKQQAKDVLGFWTLKPEAMKKSLLANPLVAVPRALGAKSLDVARDLSSAVGTEEFDPQGDPTGRVSGAPVDIEKTSQDVAALATMLATLRGGRRAAEAPLSSSEVAGTMGKGVRSAIRSIADAKPIDIQEAASARAKEAREFETQGREKLAEARGAHETEVRERETAKQKAQKEAAEERTKKFEEHKATKQAAEASAAERKRVETKNIGFTRAQQALKTARDQLVQRTRQMLDNTLAAKEKYFEAKYGDFRRKILGATEANPKGTLRSQLSPIGEDVLFAKKNILKGSETNIQIFNSILGRLKEMIEAPDGTVKPLEGQVISTEDLRGYSKEMGDAIYKKDVPSDVRQAIEYVRDKIQDEVGATIADNFGKPALEAYKALNREYWDFKNRWSDPSPVNPLPRIRDMLRDPAVTEYGVPISDRIAAILKGEKGKSVATLLAKDREFGADPKLVDSLMAVDAKLAKFRDLYEKVPPQKPKHPGEFEEPAPPKLPPELTEAKIRPLGSPPERFDPQQFVRERVAKMARTGGKIGMLLSLGSFITDILHGNVGATLSAAEKIAAVQAVKAMMTSDWFLDWVAKEQGAKPGAAPRGGPSTPPPSYRPSEKAETASAPRKSLGAEFEEGERTHEIARYKNILRDPRATMVDKVIARQRLDELGAQ